MQRAAEVEGEEVGDVDQRVDRAQADRDQPVGEPARARPVAHAADGAPEHPGTGLRHFDRPAARAGERRRRPAAADQGFSAPRPAAARSRATPRTASASPRFGVTRDLDHRIVEPRPCAYALAHRRIGGQFDDAGMVVAEPHFARREQHAGAQHAADLARLQRDAGAGNEAAGRGEHRLHAGARIRRAADDGDELAVARIDRAGAQPVGVRVLHRLDHPRDAERRQRRATVLDALEFKPDARQRVGDFGERRSRCRDARAARRA